MKKYCVRYRIKTETTIDQLGKVYNFYKQLIKNKVLKK